MTTSLRQFQGALDSKRDAREIYAALEDARRDIAILRGLLGLIRGSATYDAANLADGAGETTTVTATGAAVGDFVLVGHSIALAGMTVTGWVSAANTVSVRVQNESGAPVDLASGTLRVLVIPQATVFNTTVGAGVANPNLLP